MKEGGKKRINRTNSLPIVTVITVTFNAASFLENCIESVSSQSYPNIEYVILDGGSTDGTIEILEKMNHKISYWKSEPDLGIYDAMNKAVEYATGDWILFLGADDTLLPGFSTMCHLLRDKNCIYYGESQWQNIIHGGAFNGYRLAKFNICHQNIFYPKTVFDRYNYNCDYKVNADHYLNILCFTDKRFRFEFHPVLVAHYAAGGYSSSNIDHLFIKDKDSIIKNHFNALIYLRYKFRKFRHFITGKRPL